jgi:hypothetical protein
MTLSVDDIVRVDILVSPSAPVARGFGTMLLLGVETVLPLEERIRTYTTKEGVAADFTTSSEPYRAALLYFGQSPAPRQLKVGRRFTSAQAGKLRGSASVSALFSAYTGITNGGFDISVNGTNRQIFALDLSGAVSMAAIAALIQTKLNAALAGTTCTWTGTYFLITSPTTGTSSTVGFGGPPTGGSSPTDASTVLGLTLASGARSVNGIAIESVTDSWNASAAFDADFYGTHLTSTASVQDVKDSMAWANAGKYAYGYTTNDPNALVSSDTSNLFYYAKNLTYKRIFGQWSNTPYASVSAMARAFAVDFDQPNSTITLKFKQQPGVGIETSITETQRITLLAFNANFYASFGGTPMLSNGRMADGTPFDQLHGTDWLAATVQNAVFAPLVQTPTKIPLTDPGVSRIVQSASTAFRRGVNNGLLAPGIWQLTDIGTVKTGDLLDKGFEVFAGKVADLSASDHTTRTAPPVTAAAIGAGAIENVNIAVTFQP